MHSIVLLLAPLAGIALAAPDAAPPRRPTPTYSQYGGAAKQTNQVGNDWPPTDYDGPYQDPQRHEPPYGGPPPKTPSYQLPPYQGPPFQGPPYEDSPYEGPPSHGSPYHGHGNNTTSSRPYPTPEEPTYAFNVQFELVVKPGVRYIMVNAPQQGIEDLHWSHIRHDGVGFIFTTTPEQRKPSTKGGRHNETDEEWEELTGSGRRGGSPKRRVGRYRQPRKGEQWVFHVTAEPARRPRDRD